MSITPLVDISRYVQASQPEAVRIEPGMLVHGNVRIIELIARGGMGSVWKAQHLQLGVPVAVKFMSSALAHDADAHERFVREARSVAQLKNPHIVEVYDCGVLDAGLPYMVLAWLDGGDLASLLSKERPLEAARVLSFLSHAADGLRAAHQAQIVHRDIKPENLFLVGDEAAPQLKIVDFGVAKWLQDQREQLTLSGTTLGTPAYMSPEQMLGAHRVDQSADIWSLAVVAYECLTGKTPFYGASFGAVCLAIEKGQFPLPSRLNPKLTPAVDQFFRRAFHRKPARRFQTVDDLVAGFEQALKEQRRQRLPASIPPSVVPAERRSRAHFLAALILTCVATLAVFALLGIRIEMGNDGVSNPPAPAKRPPPRAPRLPVSASAKPAALSPPASASKSPRRKP